MMILRAAAVMLVAALSFDQTAACSCWGGEVNWQDALKQYDGVFVGEVVRIDLVEQCAPYQGGERACLYERDATIRVWTSWKGVDEGFVTVRTGGGDADCGYDFGVGGRYVIFAKGRKGSWKVDLCSPTIPEVGKGERIASLGPVMRRFTHVVGEEKW